MNYTIIGSKGFIGSSLEKKLKETGKSVQCIDKGTKPNHKKNYGTIFYCAGIKSNFDDLLYDIVRAHVSNLSCWLEQANFDHFVYLSSTRIYAEQSSGVESQRTLYLNADDLYNTTKILGETICLKSKKNVTVARLANVVGYDPLSDVFLCSLFKEAKKNKCLNLNEAPSMKRNYILLEEAIYVLIKLANKSAKGIFNLASTRALENKEFYQIIKKYKPLAEIRYGHKLINFPTFDVNKLFDTIQFKFSRSSEVVEKMAKQYFQGKLK